MKVILNDHVDQLGERGATLDVKPGFARNYLIPKGLAYQATACEPGALQAGHQKMGAGAGQGEG